MIRAAVRRPRGLLLPQGAGPAGCTPFSFPSCGKENGPCTVQKKRTLLAATLHGRAKLLYGGRRERVPACLRGSPDGRGGVRYRLERGFPRRGCKGQRGARTHLVCFSFRAFRFATRCPGIRRGRCLHRPAAEAFINHRPAAAKISAACIPDFPGLEGFTRAGRFPL